MPKQSRATIVSSIEENGDVFHEITFSDGARTTVHIPAKSELRNRFVEHGSRAKLLAAINSGKDAADSAAKVAAIAGAFKAGKWALVGEAGPKHGILAQALAALKGISVDAAQEFVATLSRGDQAKLRAAPKVATKIAELNAASAADESDALLDGFLNDDAVEA
jgi:hypothetical protein